jgi:hypothetical protein
MLTKRAQDNLGKEQDRVMAGLVPAIHDVDFARS